MKMEEGMTTTISHSNVPDFSSKGALPSVDQVLIFCLINSGGIKLRFPRWGP